MSGARRHQFTAGATLADVAREAGVSTATVSRCLNAPNQVSAALRERVSAAVAKLEYIPHGVARALASRRSRTVAAVIPTLDVAIFPLAIDGLRRRLSPAGYAVLLAVSDYDADEELRQAEVLMSRGVDAMMLVGADHRPQLLELLARKTIPFVVTWTHDPGGQYPSIGFDNRAAARLITEHVLDHGHRRIGVVIGGREHANDRSTARRAGILEALAARNLRPVPDIIEVPYGIVEGATALNLALATKPRPTAIVCGSDVFAIGALKACRELGLVVPRDLSVTGIDDLEIASHLVPSLTTIRIPAQEMGERAASYLLARLAGEQAAERTELAVTLMSRQSVGSPPSD